MFDIHGMMKDLSKYRPLFHSEADFQFALAWKIQKAMPDCEIRLELPYRVLVPQSDETDKNHLDIYLRTEKIAIELKYRTRPGKDKWNNELFVLKNQSAQNIGRYGFLKDIQRLERIVADGKAKSGVAVLLTNDPGFWGPPRQGWNETNDAKFRLHEKKQTKNSNLAWTEKTAESRKKKHPSFSLMGSYRMRWRDYSNLGTGKHQQFRYLAVSVGRGSG